MEHYCTFETRGSVTIGNLRLGDLGLLWTDVNISEPSAKTNLLSVQTQNGNIDLTNALIDYAVFENRSIQLTFILIDRDMRVWHSIDSKLKNYCHGKVMEIILDTDMSHFWRGRCSVATTKEDQAHSRFVISIDADPYKYDVASSDDDWLWDPFDFEEGFINELGNLSVNGTLEVMLIGSELRSVPEITASTAMSVQYKDKTYSLREGVNRIYDIFIGPGEHIFIFSGNGTVSIHYRGGSL